MADDNIIDINKLTSDLQSKYPGAGIESLEINKETGQSVFMLKPNKRNLAILDKPGMAITPRLESAATINRDYTSRQTLDLALSKAPYDEDPKTLYKQAEKHYYSDPLVGSATNALASLSMKGFENDIDDENIKQFYDTWVFDSNFEEVLEWVFLDFFKIGHVVTYKVLSKYEPRVSFLSPVPGQKTKKGDSASESTRLHKLHAKYDAERDAEIAKIVESAKAKGASFEQLMKVEEAAKKNIWSKGFLPSSYTVLNHQLVTIEGNLLFDKVAVKLTPPQELGQLLQKDAKDLTEEEKELIKALPKEIKSAAEQGGEFQLDSRLVGMITYRKQPYERYARPRSTRIFDALQYKKALQEADVSTLDGISNYILKITIGNDEYPVVSQQELETVAQLFNTPSKSFDVIWNHTLDIQKIVSPEIEAILGQDKYKQVNEDLTAGLAVTRALIDGTGDINAAEVNLLTKGLMEEINYARRQVEKWIYKEYQQIAEAMGFEQFPRIRWDESVLKDDILYMSTLSSLVDRRMLSYQTALEALGFDYNNELKNMQLELPLVEDGVLGIVGSPFQQSVAGPGVQPKQKSPKGTPSKGRPAGETKTKKKTNTNPDKQPGSKPTKTKKTASIEDVKDMTNEQYASFLSGVESVLGAKEYADFLDSAGEIRYGK